MTYTEKELDQFLHGISLSLLSKKSAQHWRYDEETAKEIEWLEVLERKVRADKADRKTEPNSSEIPTGSTISKMEQVEPQTEQWHYDEKDNTWYPYQHKSCATCKHALGNWDGESNNCGRCCGADRRFYEPKDKSQTDCETCKYGQDKHRYAHICNECGVGINNYTPQTERIKTLDYCDICNHKGCDNCIANNLDDYCVPSGYAPKDTPQTDEEYINNLPWTEKDCPWK